MSGSISDDDGVIKPFTAEQEQDDGGGAVSPEIPADQGGRGSVSIPHAESREDMFVDANDVIAQEVQSQESENESELKDEDEGEGEDESSTSEGLVQGLSAKLDKALVEKEGIEKELKEEREICAREVAGLREQLKGLADGWSADGEVGTDSLLPEMINECSQFVKVALAQKLQAEKTMNELQQQIEDLNLKAQGVQDVEGVVDRMMSSLATVVNPGELLDYSVIGKAAYVERSASLLMEQYAWILYEIDQFRHSMAEAGSNIEPQGDYAWGSLFATAKAEFLEIKRREVEMMENIARLEDESRKLAEEVQQAKDASEVVKAELEREKTRCANTKEKLSMAVTKGKALVQQRDSLKQSLAEKGSELEKCLKELQEKTSAVEAAEHCKEELAKCENLAASLQELLSQRNVVLESFEYLQSMDLEGKLRWIVKILSEKMAMFDNIEEILSQTSVPDELKTEGVTVRLKWLLDLVISLKEILSLKDNILGDFEQTLAKISIPDEVQSEKPIGRLKWLVEVKQKLEDEIAKANETAQDEIDRLTASLAAEIQEKEYLKTELDGLTGKHEEMVEKECRVLSERDEMVKMLVNGSGVDIDGLEGSYHSFSDVSFLIARCLDKMKEKNSASFAVSPADVEFFDKMQSGLYIRDQELMLCKTLIEDDERARSDLLTSLRLASKELEALRGENESMTNDLNRSEEKSSLLREKLSLAVKKGKGLVQDRENLKLLLDEKKSEIEKLNLEIKRLSADLAQVEKLEADLVAAKDQRDKFEQLLLESNNSLQKVMESVDHITLPVESTFQDPIGKMKFFADYLSECQVAKDHLEEEVDRMNEESSVLASKLADAQRNLKSAEDALSSAENHILELTAEKKNVELDWQKALEEVKSRTSEFTEASAAKISLEDALSLAENNIAVLVKEREEALISKAAVETEFEKVKEEVDIQAGKLTDAYKSLKSLEDTLSEAETKMALLTEENNSFQAGRVDLENELRKMKDETAGKLDDSSLTIKSLEDALSKATLDIASLKDDKRIAEQEVSTLNSKLNACMDELSGTSGSLASKSVELVRHLTDLQMLTRNDELLSVIRDRFEKQFQNLNNMDLMLKDMNRFCAKVDSQMLHIHPIMDDSHSNIAFPYDIGSTTLSAEMENGDVDSADLDNVSLYFKKCSDGLQLRNKIVAENFEGLSSFIDQFVESLVSKLRSTKDVVTVTFERMESMKQKMMDLEIQKEEQDGALTSLEKEREVLLSACINATRELQLELVNSLLDLKSVPELEKLNHLIQSVNEESYDAGQTEPIVEAQNLLLAARKVRNHMKVFESTSTVAASVIEDLENKVTANAGTSESILRERDFFQSRVVELESEVEGLQNSCQQLGSELGDHINIVREKDLLQSRVAELEDDVEGKENLCQQLKARLGDYESILNERELLESRSMELQAEVEASQKACQQLSSKLVDHESIVRERDLLQSRVAKLESELGDYNNLEEKLKENEAKLSTLQINISTKEQGKAEDPLISTSELQTLFDKISSIEILNSELEVGGAVGSSHSSVDVNKLFYIVDSVSRLYNEINVLASEKDQLQTSLSQQILEVELLKEDVRAHSRNHEDVEVMKGEISEMTAGLERVINALGGNEVVAAADPNPVCPGRLLQQLEKQANGLLSEAENSKSHALELGNRLLESQKVVDELSTRLKMLEDSVQSRSAQPEIFQERSIMFEGSSRPSGSEISEVDDASSVGKNPSPPVPKAAHVRTTRKGSTDHLAISIDSESATLINKEETDEDKGHLFKSLNTSGLIPKQGKSLADRVDGIWVSGGRNLMSRPRARLGLIAYWLLLHVWVLATIV
ncbi:unnamed protein product [Linum tenue]|uniref:Uncharacterized protein n=1 Tax=Linum tenue TaxID=586396 RepID=A0AAV0KUE6_9ROSI|nr:unnamed protein product [Linum tenue]